MSDNITKRVGLGTAYGFAKAGGYEGTVEEFTELLGNIAIDLARIENLSVTVTTLPAGSQATASLNGSVLSLGIPKGDKGNKGDTGETGAPAGFGTVSATVDANIGTPSVEVTASGSDTAKNFAFAFHNLKGQKGDKGDTGEVSEAELAETLEAYAKTDGYYSNLTAGSAEQLLSTVTIEDEVPYLFRTSGGSIEIGDRETDCIVGGSVAWNQLVNTGDVSVTVQSGHKYYANINGVKTIGASNGTAISINDATKDNVHDLTLMLGSTIADYIYSLEQATAGAGVAFFKSLFPKPYYAYNAGELMSVRGLASHDMVGFNAWDEEWDIGDIDRITGEFKTGNYLKTKNLIRVLPNTSYYINIPSTIYLYEYDADENAIVNNGAYAYHRINASGTYTTSANTHYLAFRNDVNNASQTYNHDICINLSWDGSRDGEYEPYVKHSYPLDSDLTLRGIPKLDANNNLYYDGDVYEADGTVTRRYGVAVLNGTQTASGMAPAPNPNGGYNVWFTYANAGMGDAKLGTVDIPKLSDKFMYVPRQPSGSGDPQNNIPIGSFSGNTLNLDGYIVFALGSEYDTFAKIHAWFASHPTTVIYELATPTTETADPYTNPQIVNDFGTEEYVSTNIVPVGHKTQYMPNLRAKLEMSPDSPNGDGDYIVRQTNGTNEYVSIANNATIQNILARLEALEG